MQKLDTSNTFFNLASDLVNHTSKDIFLTGRAGTGKTTFLKYIKESCPKQMVVVAPTGVAAINAGGVTIHSFFQLPFSPFIPEARGFSGEETTNKHTLLGRLRLTAERRKIMQELELLIIDEISMVRCDVLDAIDLVLRHVRFRHSERFGGVQVLFIGDMYQLPPVVKEAEWKLLSEYYKGPYFFDSHAMKANPPVYIEFTKIYRQTEKKFIDLLNRVRNNELEAEHLHSLNERHQPNFFGAREEGYILLTTHNEKARQINTEELSKLPGKMYSYKAEVKDDFPASAFPADEILQLKIGTQVMFIKNDMDKTKRYFNGKIGVVTELEEDKILVQCKGETDLIEVVKETWENIHYTLDKSTRQLDEKILGSFNQYPLRLAWAITIHKSQGLTFEKAAIDAGKAFAPGQVYVALSRCTSLEGMILHSKINPGALLADDRIVQFTKSILAVEELQQELVAAKKVYEQKLLFSLFDFRKQVTGSKEIQAYLLQHASSFNTEVFAWVDNLLSKFVILQTTADKFRAQLGKLFLLTETEEKNVQLQERLKTAANWFSSEIKSVVELILQSPAITDSTIHAKEYNELLREIYIQLSMQNFMMQGFSGIFTIENFYRRRKSFAAPSFGVNAYAGASERKVELSHPALYYQLKRLRDDICSKKNLPIFFVASSKTLEEMTTYLPQTLEELEQVSGFGKSKVEAYGNDFLSIIRNFSVENNLTSNISEKSKKPKRKETKESKRDTKLETFNLYQKGKTIVEIAKERNLTIQTIEGHLAYYVQNGLIKVGELVSREKIVLIESELQNFSGGTIAPIKEKLGNNASWGEIRLVFAWVEYQRSSSHVNH
jgi:hypothetical protein